MNAKKIGLDQPTLRVLQKMLSTPPKAQDEMKTPQKKKKRSAKGPASSAKPRSA